VKNSFIVFVALCAVASVAHADDAEAKRRYARGLKAYNLQEFKVALDEFRGAYVEKPDAVFLFNIGQCQRNLGQYDAASAGLCDGLCFGRSPVTHHLDIPVMARKSVGALS